MANLLIVFISFIMIIPMSLSLWFSLRLFLTNLDRVSFTLFMIVVCIEFWAFSMFILLIGFSDPPFHIITPVLSRLGTYAIYLSGIGVYRAIDKPFYGRNLRIFTLIGIGLNFALIALVTIDLISPEPFLYILEHTGDGWHIMIHPIISIFSIISFYLLFCIIVVSYKRMRTLPSFLFSETNLKKALILSTGLIIFLFCGLIFAIVIFSFTPPDIISLGFVIGEIVLTFILTYASLNQPFLYFGGAMQPKILLKLGYIGYFLSTWEEQGPTPHLVCSKFIEFTGLSESALHNLSVNAISAIGMGQQHIALVPVPDYPDLTALGVTFTIKNPQITVEKLKDHSPSMFAILFPSVITLALNQINRALPIILSKIGAKETISELADHNYLQEITVEVFRRLQY